MTRFLAAASFVLPSLLGASAAHAQCDGMATVELTLMDSGPFAWDIMTDGNIQNGSIDAYDEGMVLRVDTAYFPAMPGVMELGGRGMSRGPAMMSGLQVTRKVYVPATERWARFLEVFTNTGPAPITATVRIETNCGSDGGTTITGSSSGDSAFSTADRWLTTDDTDGSGDPSLNHNFWGAGAMVMPMTAGMVVFSCAGSEGPFVEYRLTVPAGRTVILMHFGGQNMTRALSQTNAMAIDGLPMATLFGMTTAEQSQVVNWRSICDTMDRDGDGTSCIAGDCDDDDPLVRPGATELCNGLDDNCVMGIDEGFTVGAPCMAGVGECMATGMINCSMDGTTTECDAMEGVPGRETCNGLDDDCDGVEDSGETDLCMGSPTGLICGTTMPGTGFCGCNTTTDCPMTAPFCVGAGAGTLGRCMMNCAGPGDCPAEMPLCIAGRCVQCTPLMSDACMGDRPRCLDTGVCGCMVDTDCPLGQFCHGTMRSCVSRVDAGPIPRVDAGPGGGVDAGGGPGPGPDPGRGGRAGCACAVPGAPSSPFGASGVLLALGGIAAAVARLRRRRVGPN